MGLKKCFIGRKLETEVNKISPVQSLERNSEEGLKYLLITQRISSFIKSNFIEKRIFLVCNIKNLGKSYCTVTIKSSLDTFFETKTILIFAEIVPLFRRDKIHCLILNLQDIKQAFGIDLALVHTSESLLIKKFQFILSHLLLVKIGNYSKLVIPCDSISSEAIKASETLKTYLLNTYQSHKLVAREQPRFKAYLDLVCCESYTVLRKVIKIHNTYVVLTVEKNVLTKSYSLILYNVRTCQKYITYITGSDLGKLNPEFSTYVFSLG